MMLRIEEPITKGLTILENKLMFFDMVSLFSEMMFFEVGNCINGSICIEL